MRLTQNIKESGNLKTKTKALEKQCETTEQQREKYKDTHDSELRQFYAVRRTLTEELKGEPINIKEWQREYDDLRAKYAGLRAQYNPLKEELEKLRSVQYQVSRVINERSQNQQVQKKREAEQLT